MRIGSAVFAGALGAALAAGVSAQTRHDEKPHGPPKAEAKKKPGAEQPRAYGARHDEKPHGASRAAEQDAKK